MDHIFETDEDLLEESPTFELLRQNVDSLTETIIKTSNFIFSIQDLPERAELEKVTRFS